MAEASSSSSLRGYSSDTINRIRREHVKIKKDAPPNCSAGPDDESNITQWSGVILGPTESPFEGGVFHLSFQFPKDYPYKPPYLKFKTKVYHPNISPDGDICLDILKPSAWSPALTITKVLLSICSLLTDPNPNDPLWGEPARLIVSDRARYNEIAREWVVKYANV